ncbi:GNAT family N-acetyltransferase [Alkalicoccus chagannorensis]|uniref:GNAT family N-acetyltransferase n=1 Tax=Alkalicoccus chagannorensis TaxID=427072 RepID=UPI0004291A52|nr:GNAT family protein [Alkalicoccus chagannorensis]
MSSIQFRPFEKKDQQRLIDWIESPAFLVQWGGPQFTYPLTEEQLDEYRESGEKENADRLIYSVLDAETDAVIGHISLSAIEKENGSARIGKVLVGDNAGRGGGIGTKMIREMLRIAFDELQLHRVGLGVYDFNTPAIACYEKAGFSRDGRLRDVRKVDGSYWSLIEMSILETEWEEVQHKPERSSHAEERS